MLAFLLACTNENEVVRRTGTDVFLQEPAGAVDILFIVDNSQSMEQEQARLSLGFESFVESIAATNVDFHIGVINTDMDLDNPARGQLLGNPPVITGEMDYVTEFRKRVRVGTDGSGKEKGLSAAIEAVTEPLASGANSGFLREEAVLLAIFLSDENDCSDNEALAKESDSACYEMYDKLVPVPELLAEFKSVKAPGVRVLASAIVGPPVSAGCEDSWPGHRYTSFAESTGGIVGDICDTDYSGMLGEMGLAVSGVLTTFQLEHQAIPETIEVVVDDEIIPEDPVEGWTYDAENSIIRFDGDYVPPRGSTISITYEITG